MDPLDRACALHDRALAHHESGRVFAARRAALAACRLFTRHSGARHPDTANVLDTLAMIDLGRGDFRAARRHLRRAVSILDAARRHPAARPLRAQSVERMGECLRDAGRYVEARAWLSRAVVLQTRLYGRRSLERAAALNQLGMCCKYAGWFALGARAYREALTLAEELAPSGALVKVILRNLAGLEHARDRFTEAERYARRGVELRLATEGPSHPATELDLGALAPIVAELGRLDEAEAMLRPLVDSFAARYGARHYEVAVVCHNLGAVLAARGQVAEAASLYRRALAIKRARLGATHPDIPLTMHNLAALDEALGRHRSARRLRVRALALALRALGARHPTTRACAAALTASESTGAPTGRG